MILRYIVTKQEEGKPLLDILRGPMGISAGGVKALKFHGGLLVDGTLRFTNYIVSAGETVTADVTLAQADGDNIPESGDLDVLWEDEGLIAVNKPPGIIVHPSRAKNSGTLANFVAGYLQDKGERPVCHIVNRLDRDTSGIVIFAKNPYMKDRTSQAMRVGGKKYKTLVLGTLDPPNGMIDLPIKRQEPKNMYRITAPDGKAACTEYHSEKVLTLAGESCSLLDISLHSGRTHQIRVHMLAKGAPLLGDPLYHTAKSKELSQALELTHQLLHCYQLSFLHPHTKEMFSITCLPREGPLL